MKKSVTRIAIFCLLALLLQACGVGTPSPAPDASTSSDAATSESPASTEVTLTEEQLYDKMAGGWIGQMVGVAWAAPTEFRYAGTLMPENAMPTWTPDTINDAFGQDDLYVEIPFLDAMRLKGVDCSATYIARKFKDTSFFLDHANAIGRENLKNGIAYPNSGSYLYNYHSDDIDWQIECDFLGMMYPGMPNEAAKRAFELGHIMNYGDGVYGGVFVSAMHAAAYTAQSIEEICQAGISVIPEGTEFRKLVDDVMASYKAGDSFEENWKTLEAKWAPYDLCPRLSGKSNIDAKLNSGYILLGLLYGEGDFAKTIILSTRCGQDSDCNPSSAASILGNFYGAANLPKLYTSGLDYDGTNFSTTSYTFRETVDLNFTLMKEVLEKAKATKTDDGAYVFPRNINCTPVPFEQWPDGVFLYLNIKSSKNTVTFVELTPYSKNEHITGYEIDLGDGNVFTDVTPITYTYEKAGEYLLKVTVTGEKGGTATVERTITVKEDLTSDISPATIVCSVSNPGGGGSKDIGVICDGVVPQSGSANDKMQYDTYAVADPNGNPEKAAYIGYLYKAPRTVSQIVFTEGNHFSNGGWFQDGTLTVELFIDGKWQAASYTSSADYPKGNTMSSFGKPYETYIFTLQAPTPCSGVRLYGTAGGSAGFISVGELEIR